jgi:hypothetical protein
VQHERRHRQARPLQRVDHGDGLRGSHVSRRRSAGRRSERYARRRGARCSGAEVKDTGAMDTKC